MELTLETLTRFFFWSTLIHGAILILWTGFLTFAPGLTFQTQSRWFPGTREQFAKFMYGFLGLYKLLFLTFSVVPYAALLIIG